MKKLPLLLATLVSTSALASGAAPTTPDAWMNAQPSLELTVEPAGSADTYSVQAVITDKVTGKVLERPTMVIKGGAWGRAEIGAKGAPGMVSVTLAVSVEPSGRGAAYFAEFRREGGNTDTQSGTVFVSR